MSTDERPNNVAPLWCANDDPHAAHQRRNDWNGFDYCTGRPAAALPSAPTDVAALIGEAREAVAYLDAFDSWRAKGSAATPAPKVPALLAQKLVQQTIAELAAALESLSQTPGEQEWAYRRTSDGQDIGTKRPYSERPSHAGPGFVVISRTVGPWLPVPEGEA